MDVQAFTDQAKADGFGEVTTREYATTQNPDPHAHDFDARVMVTEGAIILTIGGEAKTYTSGDWCEVLSGTVHTEEVGPHGVKLAVAKRGD